MGTLLIPPSFAEVLFAPSSCPEATGAPCPGAPLGPSLGPPRPISQTHGDPLDAPTALWGHLQVPVIKTTQPQEPHLPQQPPCPAGPIPAATKNPPGVTSALGTSRLRPPASTAPPPLPPHCAPLVGRAPLPVIGPQHPLPPSRWHQSHSCQRPWAPRAAPPAPRGALMGPPLPGRGAGGLRWVRVTHARCRWPTPGMAVSARCWWPKPGAGGLCWVPVPVSWGAAWGAGRGAMGPCGPRGCF